VAEFERLMLDMHLRRQDLVRQVDASGARELVHNPDLSEVIGFDSNYLVYEGPQLPQEEELKEPFQPNNECGGWCNDPVQRRVAANLILDKSKHHDGVLNNEEWGE
jgi:hypothetical protein